MDEILIPHQIVTKLGINQEINDKIIIFKEKSFLVKIGPELSHKKQLVMLQDVTILSDIQKERYKFSYISTATHELNTPLHSLLQSLQLLEINSIPEQKEIIQTAKRSVRSLNDIVQNGMTLLNIERGKVKLNLAPVNCLRLGNKCIHSIKPESELKGLKLSFVCDSSIPCALLDKKLLRQVLMILLFNSLKYTMDGLIELTITRKNDKLLINVYDTGIGIESGMLDKIFDPFSQQDKKIQLLETGMGLNLHLCKCLMHLMNGSIKVSSAIHKSTTFILELPFIVPNSLEELQQDIDFSISPSPQKSIPVFSRAMSCKPCQPVVLIVDDNATNVFVLSSFFNKMKVQYDSAYNGQKAVEAVTHKVYDVIFMDINMPVMNGIVATNKIRVFNQEQNRPKQAIFAVTAQKEEGVTLLIEGTKFDDVFHKPMSLKLVEKIIHEVKINNGFTQKTID